MNIFKDYKDTFVACAEACIKNKGWPANSLDYLNLEPPRSLSFGDIASSLPLAIAKKAQRPAMEIATDWALELEKTRRFDSVTVNKPGFVNVKLPKTVWQDVMRSILKKGTSYGHSLAKNNDSINIEFVSANPTGPLTIANARGAIIGDVLGSLLKAVGTDVTKEYYINDSGSQIDVLAKSLWHRYLEQDSKNIGQLPKNCYPGEYLKTLAKSLKKEFAGDLEKMTENDRHVFLKNYGVTKIMELIKNDLLSLGVKMDIFSSELELVENKAVEACIDALKEKNIIYHGCLPKPEDHEDDDWEERRQLLFMASKFGDDRDRPLQKSDGSWTYFASDIAYHLDKTNRLDKSKNRVLIDIVGADHSGYITRIASAVKALTENKVAFKALVSQIVRVIVDGKVSKMSKRAGNMVLLQELLQELSSDVLRFYMLTRSPDASIDIDVEMLKQNSRDNPVYYVQYAHARIYSLRQKAKDKLWQKAISADKWPGLVYSSASEPSIEKQLLHLCSQWPRTLEMSARTFEPHRIGGYLYKLSALYHQAWAGARSDKDARFIILDQEERTLSRLALSECVRLIIASGLEIMGVVPKNQLYDDTALSENTNL